MWWEKFRQLVRKKGTGGLLGAFLLWIVWELLKDRAIAWANKRVDEGLAKLRDLEWPILPTLSADLSDKIADALAIVVFLSILSLGLYSAYKLIREIFNNLKLNFFRVGNGQKAVWLKIK